ncbi:MAG: hypothetical protein ABW005_02915 [Burkholderiaceae bacterium]
METAVLMRRYAALRDELARAYREQPWQSSRIDEIADELSEMERSLSPEQAGMRLPPPRSPWMADAAPPGGPSPG